MERQWNSLCQRKNLHSKQQENYNLADVGHLGQ